MDELNKCESEGVIIDSSEKENIQCKIRDYYKEIDDGYLIRSKIRWVEEGEKSSKYFFNLEKSRQSSNVIRQIKDSDGNLQTEDNEILKAASEFYQNLFTTRNIDQQKINDYRIIPNKGTPPNRSTP